MIGRNFISRQQVITLFATLAGVALVIVLANPNIIWQVRAALFGAAGLAALFLSAREISLRLHLYLALLTLAFGWRTAQIGGVILDVQQAIAWSLLVHMFVYSMVRRNELRVRGVWLMLVTIPVSVLGLLTGWSYGRSITAMLSELGPLVLSIPVIVGLSILVRSRKDFKGVAHVLMFVILLIATPGIIGYVFPTAGSTFYRADQGFVRANFPLWGGSVAGYALTPLILLIIPFILLRGHGGLWKQLTWLTVGVGLVAVFLSGQRGAWIAFATSIVTFAFFIRKWRIQVLIALFVIWLLLPASVKYSLISVTDVSQKTAYNSSASKRFNRAEGTYSLIIQSPLIGSGVGASGWAHTDVLQIAANFGIPAAVLLLLSWFWPIKAIVCVRSSELYTAGVAYDELLIRGGLLAAAVASVILLATQALIVISALALPVWIVIGLLHAESQIIETECISTLPVISQQG